MKWCKKGLASPEPRFEVWHTPYLRLQGARDQETIMWIQQQRLLFFQSHKTHTWPDMILRYKQVANVLWAPGYWVFFLTWRFGQNQTSNRFREGWWCYLVHCPTWTFAGSKSKRRYPGTSGYNFAHCLFNFLLFKPIVVFSNNCCLTYLSNIVLVCFPEINFTLLLFFFQKLFLFPWTICIKIDLWFCDSVYP